MLRLDLRSLGLLRIAYGLLILIDLAVRAGSLRAHYTDWGVAPRDLVQQLASSWPAPCLHMLSGTSAFQALLFSLQAAAALALTLGYRVRWFGPICWFFLCSLQTRNPLVCDGGDDYLRVILFWCLFLPWGSRLALRPEPEPRQSRLAAFCYLAQLACIYWFALALKSGADWWDGQAVSYALNVDQLTTPLAGRLLGYPNLMKALTYCTLTLELAAPLLLWWPGRPRLLGIVLLGGMHLGFAMFMHLGLFPWIGLVSCWGLLPWSGRPDFAPPPRHRGFWLLLYPLVLVLQWNLLSLPFIRPRYKLNDQPLKLLRLDQFWGMFAPRPGRDDGWYVIEADLEDGRKIDLWRPNQPLSWEKPRRVALDYRDSHWRRYMMTLYFPNAVGWRGGFARYLTRSWNQSHRPGERARGFRIYFMLEVTGEPAVRKLLLWTHDCQLKS